MLTPTVTEIRRALEPVARDPFIEAAVRSATVIAFPVRDAQLRATAAAPRAA
jgi:hypothetical protein